MSKLALINRQHKREKLVAKARKQLAKVGRKADAFVDKKKAPITAACRDAIRAALDRIDAVPVRTLAARQQKVDRGRGGAAAIHGARVAEGLAKVPALGMRLELQQADYRVGG